MKSIVFIVAWTFLSQRSRKTDIVGHCNQYEVAASIQSYTGKTNKWLICLLIKYIKPLLGNFWMLLHLFSIEKNRNRQWLKWSNNYISSFHPGSISTCLCLQWCKNNVFSDKIPGERIMDEANSKPTFK